MTMTKEEIIEVEDNDEFRLPTGCPLTKSEALAYIVWKMHEKGLVHVEKSDEDVEEERREDEILKEFGI